MFRTKKSCVKIAISVFVVISLFSSVILAEGNDNSTSALFTNPQINNSISDNTLDNTDLYVNEVIVKYKDKNNSDIIKQHVREKFDLKNLKHKKYLSYPDAEVITVDSVSNVADVVRELNRNENVEYAEPNYKVYPCYTPNDPGFNSQWGLSNTGQTVNGAAGVSGIDVKAITAWDITRGSSSIVVGVLDTGIKINHPDLSANIYINTKEIAGNNIDDDKNGYIDDINGWDFPSDDNTVFHSDGLNDDTHGTYCAGIIAATTNNSQGIAGMAPNIKILPLKFCVDPFIVFGTVADCVEAINYGVKMGVRIFNCSFSFNSSSTTLETTMRNYTNVLFVTSAGNDSADLSTINKYPAKYSLSNQIVVAAIDSSGNLASFSNYGTGVDVAAPGKNILTTNIFDGYSYQDGTSFAAPFVVGEAALILSKFSTTTWTGSSLKARIKAKVTTLNSLNGKVNTSGLINVYKAVSDPLN